MAVITRATKGSPLTNAELDNNFTETAAIANAANNTAASALSGSSNSAAAAALSATQSAAARDAAIQAWQASTAPAETLAGFSQSLHYGAVVKAFVYDTSKDSDGGAWRKRCQHTSWYKETICTGKWLGQKLGGAQAWATSGAVAGDFFQATVDGKFYALTGTNGASEVFRGNVREIPALIGAAVESARIVLYDLTAPGAPMWMVFACGTGTMPNGYLSTISSVSIMNGLLVVGMGPYDLHLVNFIKDSGELRNNVGYAVYKQNIAARNTNVAATYFTDAAKAIVNRTVNDVALTVLDNAPIDPATGLAIPTIAVATAGGVSVIQNTGTVVNSANTGSRVAVSISPTLLTYSGNAAGDTVQHYAAASSAANAAPVAPGSLGASFATSYASLVDLGVLGKSTDTLQGKDSMLYRRGGTSGIQVVKFNPASPASSLYAAITTTFNTGWMPGDVRGCYLADTTAETIVGSGELVTNGTFDTDLTGWDASASTAPSTVTWSGGAAVWSTDGAANGRLRASITTVVGKTYLVTRGGTLAANAFFVGSEAGNSNVLTAVAANTPTSFVAISTTTYIGSTSNVNGATLDSVSVKLAEPDRSVKGKGLVINGTLQKTAVASGSQLVAYSGFSASNYLEQPYNADLDFGTGDFCVMGWVNITSSTGTQIIFNRGSSGAPGFGLAIVSGAWVYVCHATNSGSGTEISLSTGLHHFSLQRVSGVLYLYVDGVSVYSIANTVNITNVAAKLTTGVWYDYTAPLTGASLALLRISATAPTADQIAKIYRDELALFQPSAQCTIAGTSTAVTALGYDPDTDLLQVGTSWGRTSFNNLVRVDSEATSTGAVTSISATGGAVITGGASSGRYYQPALTLRDEIRRKEEARKALGKVPVFFTFAGNGSTKAFTLPAGYTARGVYKDGAYVPEIAAGWVRSNDGFKETVTYATAPSSGTATAAIMAVRV